MPLVNLTTNLKSLRHGNDRRSNGSSNQPYVTTPIPNGEGPGLGDVDFLLRGGSLLPLTVTQDVSRLTQMFFDLKSPNGLLFTVKQNVLSRSGVNIKAVSGGVINSKNNRLPLNNGIYLPTSTILQAAANPLGGHLLKQGINPFVNTNNVANGNILSTGFGPSLPLSQPLYLDTVAQNERQNSNLSPTSRLVSFTNSFIKDGILKPDNPGRYVTQQATELYSYSGGPGSTLGIGKTNISISKNRTGRNNPFLAGDKSSTDRFFLNSNKTTPKPGSNSSQFSLNSSTLPTLGTGVLNYGTEDYSVFIRPSVSYQSAKIFNNTLSKIYTEYGGADLFQGEYTLANNSNSLQTFSTNVFQPGTLNPQAPTVVSGLGSSLDYNQLMKAKGLGNVAVGSPNNNYPQAEILEDFRQTTSKTNDKVATGLKYSDTQSRYEPRVNLGNAGAKNRTTSYVTGNNEALDKINKLQIYKSNNIDPSKEINDLCKFRIGVIDNDNPSLKTYIHFRAFIDSMDDNYSAEWSSQKFSGRAENLYNYQGFDRKFNLSWTVAAQSKQELIPMYQKLNYLASVCAPDYSSDGYMRGNLIELTVGGYLFNQVGIMTGINYTVPMESPWEIAIDTKGGSDESVKELPFMIKVSGFSFIPIHNFVPSIQKNTFSLTDEKLLENIKANNANLGQNLDTVGDLATFGEQRYIALSNGFNQNYSKDG